MKKVLAALALALGIVLGCSSGRPQLDDASRPTEGFGTAAQEARQSEQKLASKPEFTYSEPTMRQRVESTGRSTRTGAEGAAFTLGHFMTALIVWAYIWSAILLPLALIGDSWEEWELRLEGLIMGVAGIILAVLGWTTKLGDMGMRWWLPLVALVLPGVVLFVLSFIYEDNEISIVKKTAIAFGPAAICALFGALWWFDAHWMQPLIRGSIVAGLVIAIVVLFLIIGKKEHASDEHGASSEHAEAHH